jgi:hypothetical protein
VTEHIDGTGPAEGDEERFEEWLRDRPETIKRLGRAYPPWFCYRSAENPRFHYRIVAYNEHGTVTLAHARDSTLPGVATFGQPPEQLHVCACGQWQEPTPEQRRATAERMRKWARAPGGAHHDCTDPKCLVCNIDLNLH